MLLAVKVTVLVEVVLEGLNVAVTPEGSPELVRLTLPLKPFSLITEMVVLWLEPGVSESVPAEEESEKPDVATFNAIETEEDAAPEVPVMVAV